MNHGFGGVNGFGGDEGELVDSVANLAGEAVQEGALRMKCWSWVAVVGVWT